MEYAISSNQPPLRVVGGGVGSAVGAGASVGCSTAGGWVAAGAVVGVAAGPHAASTMLATISRPKAVMIRFFMRILLLEIYVLNVRVLLFLIFLNSVSLLPSGPPFIGRSCATTNSCRTSFIFKAALLSPELEL
jgi:hypothetical protein